MNRWVKPTIITVMGLGLIAFFLSYSAQPQTVATRLLGSYFNLSTKFFHSRLLQEDYFKNRYRQAYARILSGTLLQEHVKLIDKASLSSGEFPDFFSEDAGNRIMRVVLTEVRPETLRGYAVVRDRYIFNFQESRPKMATFVRSYRVVGWSQQEFQYLLQKYPVTALKARRVKRYDFEIRRDLPGGRIRELDGKFLRTQLDAVMLEDGRQLGASWLLRDLRRLK